MPDYLGTDQRKVNKDKKKDEKIQGNYICACCLLLLVHPTLDPTLASLQNAMA